MALFIAGQDAGNYKREDRINFWPLSIALRDVRKALAYFQRREELPEPDFPTSKELIALANQDGRDVGLEGARKWLMDRRVI